MQIRDRVYGRFTVTEPVILELLKSQPLIRLKKINQAGVSNYLHSWKNISRFEHSVGVMLLLRKFGASLEEQIAGLLHDVPHTAFSHVVDFIFKSETHEYHEKFHEQLINNSKIPKILKKYTISPDASHPEKYSLLERNIPDICADRIDYALRDFIAWKRDMVMVKEILSGLKVHKNEFIFSNINSAVNFAHLYLNLDKTTWADPREVALYEIIAQAISHSLKQKILAEKDLFTDDEAVMGKLRRKADSYIRQKLAYLNPNFRVELATKPHHHLYIRTKVRNVDPKILRGKKLIRLSQLSPKFEQQLETHQELTKNGWYVNVYKG